MPERGKRVDPGLFGRLLAAVNPLGGGTLGTSGTAVHGGFIQDPEKNSALRGTAKYKTFSEFLANVSIVAAGTRYFLNMASRATWRLDPAPGGEELAERVEKLLMEEMETPWHRIVRRAAMYRFYGFSVQEWTADRKDDGVIGFVDIEARPQLTIDRWDVDEIGKVLGMIQCNPRTGVEHYLPRGKVVYVVDDTLNDSPEGLGLFRHIAESARRLRRYEQLEGFGFETDLRGMPIARAPFSELRAAEEAGKISAADRTAIEKPIRDFVTKHIKSPELGILLDSITYQSLDDASSPSSVKKWDVELLKGSSTSLPQMADAIQRVNREIARILGVETLLLGETGAGSLAMAVDKSQTFALIVDSTLRDLRGQLTKDVLDPLWALNGWDLALKPTLKTDPIQFRSVMEIAETLERMARAGATLPPDDPAINVIRDLLGLPQADLDRIMVDALDDEPPSEDDPSPPDDEGSEDE